MKRAGCLFLLFLAADGPVQASVLDALSSDGWHAWQVPVEGVPRWCCVEHLNGKVTRGCNLDGRHHGYTNCEGTIDESGHLLLYARIESGAVARLTVSSPGCPVRSAAPVTDLGTVEVEETFDWLLRLVREHDQDRDVREDAVFALSQLSGDRAVDALLALVEDRQLDHELRETALFWLVQSESDRAFAAVERLLADDSAR